jgi:hypothetical protein
MICTLLLATKEALKNTLVQFSRDTDASVRDAKTNVVFVLRSPNADTPAVGCEFYRIFYQIDYRPLKLACITQETG